MCINCKQMYPKKELIRIVKNSKDGIITIDETGKISGKGAYVCHNSECIKNVIKNKKLDHYLGKIPDEIYKKLNENISRV